jgi:hypothetical protein
VPDDFPTLEAAAAFGVLVAGIRAYLIHSLAARTKKLHTEVVGELRGGNAARALTLCESSPARSYPRVAEQLIIAAADRSPGETSERTAKRLHEVFEASYAIEARRIQSGRGRDLVVMAVLVGAAFYARSSELAVSVSFYVLLALGSVLLLWGAIARRGLLDFTRRASEELIAASAELRPSSADIPSTCSSCGSPDQLSVLDPDRLDGGLKLGLESLRICRSCGHVDGQVLDPAAIPVGASFGTHLVAAGPASEDSLTDDEEAEG